MLTGACHCGAVRWTLQASPQSVTACNCTICRRYGALWAYGIMDVDIVTTGQTGIYRRSDSGDIDFHFCAACGCLTHYVGSTGDQDGRRVAAVNVRMADLAEIETLPIRHFDGDDTFEALPGDGRTVKDLWF